MDIDYLKLRDCVLEPPRPGAGAAEQALRKYVSPGLAWRSLFGNETPWPRWFLRTEPCRSCKGTGRRPSNHRDSDGVWNHETYTCGVCLGTGDDPRFRINPVARRVHVRALGDSVDAVRAAETHAHELAARLNLWGVNRIDTVMWRIGGAAHHRAGPVMEGIPPQVESTFNRFLVPYRAEAADRFPAALAPETRGQPYTHVREQIRNHACWQCAVRDGLRAPDDSPLAGRSLAEVPNPYSPLLRVWLTGFGVDRILDHAVIVYAPPV